MNIEEKLKTYKILVRPILEYCSAIYLETAQKTTDTTQTVQNKAIRIIISAPRKFPVTTGRTLLNLSKLHSKEYTYFKNLFQKQGIKTYPSPFRKGK